MASCTATSYITVHMSLIDAVDKLSLPQSIHQHLDLLIISASLILRSQHADMLFEYDMYLVARLASSRVRPLFSFSVSHDTPLPLPRTWYAPIHILDESIIYVTSRHAIRARASSPSRHPLAKHASHRKSGANTVPEPGHFRTLH